MSAISDIAKLLEQIPVWRRLKALPEQLEALQARVSALEEEIRKRPSAEACPLCGKGALRVTAVRPHPVMGDVGLQERTLKCDNAECGHTEARMHDPAGRLDKKR